MEYQLINPRCEADLYGYSVWLSSHLGLTSIPLSRRGFQHGWCWYNYSDAPKTILATVRQHGESLVQDHEFANGLTADGIVSFAAGLPFLNFLRYSGFELAQGESRRGVLFIPTHSISGSTYDDLILRQVRWYCKYQSAPSILLSLNDAHLSELVRPYVDKIEIGASSNEAMSFPRLADIFSRYEGVVALNMGSALYYASACGCKVAIAACHESDLTQIETRGADKAFLESNNLSEDEYQHVQSLSFLESRFPGLISLSLTPRFTFPRTDSDMHPRAVARLLGWQI